MCLFKKLLNPKELLLCLFIDGLDEYEGFHEDIVRLFQNAVESSHVEICLSSRPVSIRKCFRIWPLAPASGPDIFRHPELC